PALLHGDAGPSNLLVREAEDGWHVSGLVDFGQTRIGDPVYDLVAPGIGMLGGRRDLVPALLGAYGSASAAVLTRYAFLHEWAKVAPLVGGRFTDWTSVERALWPGAPP